MLLGGEKNWLQKNEQNFIWGKNIGGKKKENKRGQ